MIWYLERHDQTNEIWGKTLDMVVRAADEVGARRVAAISDGEDWSDPTKTSCKELESEGPDEIITYYNVGM